MLPLLLLFLFPAAVQDGGLLNDADFGFTIRVPPGMELVPEEEAITAGLMAGPNVPRAETPEGRASHNYVWRDATGGARELRLLLQDNPPPFTSEDGLIEYLETRHGLQIDEKKALDPPDAPPKTLYLEGSRTTRSGLRVRHTAVYYLFSPQRFFMLQMFAPEDTWAGVEPELMAALASIEVPKPQGPMAGGARARRPKGAGPGAAALDPAADDEDADWGRLEATGSLVLAALLLFGLVTGRRSA